MTESGRVRVQVEIVNKRGLHARASAKFVALATKYAADISVSKDDSVVSARSIMGLMMLGAGLGSHLDISAAGADAETALAALAALVAAKFDEDE